jgi:hypothetical protein
MTRQARGDADTAERYLRRLARWLPRRERQGLVLEARRHLYDATLRYEAAGLDHATAQHAAIEAFGPAWRIGLAARGVDERMLRRLSIASVPLLRAGRRLPRLGFSRQPKPPLR